MIVKFSSLKKKKKKKNQKGKAYTLDLFFGGRPRTRAISSPPVIELSFCISSRIRSLCIICIPRAIGERESSFVWNNAICLSRENRPLMPRILSHKELGKRKKRTKLSGHTVRNGRAESFGSSDGHMIIS